MNKLFTTFLIIISAISINTYAQSVWQWQQPQPTGNFMWAVDFVDENTGYAAGDVGTVMKTTNGGVNWEVKIVDPDLKILGMDFYDSQLGFVVGDINGSVYRTSNGGDNWTLVLTANVLTMWDIDFPTRNTGYAVGLNGKIYKSTDSGLNWIQQNSSTNTFLFSVDFLDSLNGVAGGNRLLTKTTNGGINWIQQNLDMPNPFAQVTSVNFIDQNHIYGLVQREDSIYKTTNGGINWFGQFISRINGDIPRSISFINPDTGLMVTDIGLIKRTSNAGVNWITDSTFKSSFNDNGVLWALQYYRTNIAFVSGSGGRVIKSVNGGQNWIATTGGRNNYNSVFFVNTNTGFSVGADGKILKTTNAGLNWIEKESNTNQFLKEVQFVNDNVGYICGDTGTVLKSIDGGESWSIINTNTNFNLNGISAKNDLNVFVAGKNGTLKYSTDGGIIWNDINLSVISEFKTIQFIDNSVGYLTSNLLYKTTNGGLNWINMTTAAGLDTYFIDSLFGYSTGGSGNILKTTNGGVSWVNQSGNVINNLNSIFMVNRENGYAVGDEGAVTKTTNGGINWIPQERLTNNRLLSVYFTDADNGYISGNFGTLIKTTNGGLVFISQNTQSIPEEYTLYQNYPNPFNSGTVIKYDLKTSGFVELKIYDVTGKEIQKLVSEEQSEGSYSILFSNSEIKVNLQSGVYLYSLFMNKKLLNTKKLILIK